VATGYIGRDDLTAERFLADPFTPVDGCTRPATARRNCRTARSITKGRIDGQVKVRGYRIELGEVEVAMEKHAAIEQAVANVREDRPGLKRLIGYYVAKHEVSTNDLRKHLASLLPDYMVPFRLRGREGIATHTQWQDRSQGTACARCETSRTWMLPFAAPQTGVQKTLANVWADLLGIDRVGIDDNFFDLGGNSLLSIQASRSWKAMA
jgi:hypothetical protein